MLRLKGTKYFQLMRDAVATCESKWLSSLDKLQRKQCMFNEIEVPYLTGEPFAQSLDDATTMQEILLLAKSINDHAQELDNGYKHSMIAKLQVYFC